MKIDNNIEEERKQSHLKTAYNLCKLLKIEPIKEEIDNCIENYYLIDIKYKNGNFECEFKGEGNNSIVLSLCLNSIHLIRYENDTLSSIKILSDQVLRQIDVEKREVGVIYTEIEKHYEISKKFENQNVLTDIYERQYVFKNDNILFNNIDFKKQTLMSLLFKFKSASLALELKDTCDLYNSFSTHMNYYVQLKNGRRLKDNIYPTKTYFNEEDVSSIFDVNDGKDKLYRVYDLYRGIINPKNMDDIKLINLGFLPTEAFNFKDYKGISEKEDTLVGKSLEEPSNKNIIYISKAIEMFGYPEKITPDRESILKGITYTPPKDNFIKEETPNIHSEEHPEKYSKAKKIIKRILKKNKINN